MPQSRAAAPTCGSPGALIARGHKLRVARPWSAWSKAGVIVDEKNGVLSGSADHVPASEKPVGALRVATKGLGIPQVGCFPPSRQNIYLSLT